MAAPSATVNGTPVNFAFQGTNGITVSNLSGVLLQSADMSAMADSEVTRDGLGAEVTHGWYNFHLESTLEYVVTSASLAGAINNTSLTAGLIPGAFVTITACTSMPQFVATWETQSGAKVTKTNTTSAKISVPIRQYGGITAVAS